MTGSQSPDNDQSNDMARLIQEVLAELGSRADPIDIAKRVRGLDRGLPAEDEFAVICTWLGQCALIHKLGQQQAPLSSRDVYQVPDLLATFQTAGPFLIEVKVKRDQTLSFRPDYLRRLMAYADLIGAPLLIAWKFHKIWSLIDARCLKVAKKNFNITHSEAMQQSLMGVIVGDVAYSLGAGTAVHLDCVKERLVGTGQEGGCRTEQWQARITDVFFTDATGTRRDDLHAETRQLIATWDLRRYEEVQTETIRFSFVAEERQLQFAHGALVQLLAQEQLNQSPLNWRHLLTAPTITRSIKHFRQALDRALKDGVVHYVFELKPVTRPNFL